MPNIVIKPLTGRRDSPNFAVWPIPQFVEDDLPVLYNKYCVPCMHWELR